MSEQVQRLISSIVPVMVDALHRRAASETRLCVSGDKGLLFPIWVSVQQIDGPQNRVIRTVAGVRDTTLELPESELSSVTAPLYWAHTNDFDGMVYGWGAAELYVVNRSKEAVVEAIIEHLTKKLDDQTRIDIRLFATACAGMPHLPTVEGNSDSGPEGIHEQPEFNGF